MKRPPRTAAAPAERSDVAGRRLLVVGTTPRAAMRRYLPDAARRLGMISVLFADHDDPENEALFDRVVRFDLDDEDGLERRARAGIDGGPYDAVVTSIESHVVRTARLARALGLPGLDPEAGERARSKLAMRRAFEAAGLAVPRFVDVTTAEDLLEALEVVGLPAIVKPQRGWSSFGVRLLRVGDDVEAIVRQAARAVEEETGEAARFLVESVLEGPEFSVEGVVDRDGIRIAGITEKWTTAPPYFEEIQHVFPAALDDETSRSIVELARDAVRAVGIDLGGFHAEMRLTSDGPVMVEIAARLGGDGIPVVVRMARGIDLGEAAIRAALGQRVTLEERVGRFAGIRFVQPPRAGVVESARLDLDRRTVPGLVDHAFHAEPGTRLDLPPVAYGTRPGWALVASRRRDDLLATLDAVAARADWSFR